jgi:hypothetical protein
MCYGLAPWCSVSTLLLRFGSLTSTVPRSQPEALSLVRMHLEAPGSCLHVHGVAYSANRAEPHNVRVSICLFTNSHYRSQPLRASFFWRAAGKVAALVPKQAPSSPSPSDHPPRVEQTSPDFAQWLIDRHKHRPSQPLAQLSPKPESASTPKCCAIIPPAPFPSHGPRAALPSTYQFFHLYKTSPS